MCHLLCLCQVVTSIGELVEVCSTQIQSGWRPLFSALETVHSGNKSEVKEYLVGDYSMGKIVCGYYILKLYWIPLLVLTTFVRVFLRLPV